MQTVYSTGQCNNVVKYFEILCHVEVVLVESIIS